MSLVIAANTDYATQTTGLPTSSPYTVAGWMKATSFPGGDQFCAMLSGGGNEAEYGFIDNTGQFGGYHSTYLSTASSPASGVWVYTYMQLNTGTGQWTIGWWDGAAWVTNSHSGASWAMTTFILGNSQAFTAQFRGKLAHYRIWNVVLTQAQLLTEKDAATAQITTGLLAGYDLVSDGADGSGNGNDLTVSGAVFDAADDPLGATDTTPPTFTVGPASANVTQTAFDVQATMDETGTIYAVALASGAAAPTSAEVKAGTGSGGAAAVAFGSTAASAAAQATISLNGFTAGTAYDVYVAGEDAVPNLQVSPTLVNVTMLATPHVVFAVAANTQLVDATGAPINLTGIEWAFAEQKSPVGANVSDEGTGLSITNGEVDVVLTNTALAVGAQGALTLYNPNTDVTRRYIVTLTG